MFMREFRAGGKTTKIAVRKVGKGKEKLCRRRYVFLIEMRSIDSGNNVNARVI
jgi:hypothetical protein